MARRKNILTEFLADLISICIFLLPIGLILKFVTDNSEIFSNIAFLVALAIALIILLFVMYYVYSSIYFISKRFIQISAIYNATINEENTAISLYLDSDIKIIISLVE